MNQLLASDHRELDELLANLFSAFKTGNRGQIYQSLDIFWARLAMHIRAEHLHLFPAILRAFESQTKENICAVSPATAQTTLSQLQDDHNFFMRELTAAIKQLRENNKAALSLSIVRERIIAVSHRLKTHNELEESEVYQWADALLNPAEREDLNKRIRKELDNLPPRFSRTD